MKKMIFLLCTGLVYLGSCKTPTISEQVVGNYSGIATLDSIGFDLSHTILYSVPDTIHIQPGNADNSIIQGYTTFELGGSNGVYHGWYGNCCNSTNIEFNHDSLKIKSSGSTSPNYQYQWTFQGTRMH
jgi:hypothetical protein